MFWIEKDCDIAVQRKEININVTKYTPVQLNNFNFSVSMIADLCVLYYNLNKI